MKKIYFSLFLFYSFLAFSDTEIVLFKPERSDPNIINSIVVDPVVFADRVGLPRNYELLSRIQRRQIVYEVGNRYFRNQAYEEALFWFLVAAKRGVPEAKYKLAVLYRDVFPERSSVDQIFNLFLKAARAGVVEAQQEAAYIYLGVEQDSPFTKFTNLKKAIKWYTQLADSGSPEAQYNLARILYNQGNKEAAFQRYLEAANNGLGLAQLKVGRMLELGDGVAQNFIQALFWYRRAIVHHEASAKYQLSRMYQKGLGVARDVQKATQLLNEAIHAQRLHSLSEESFNNETYIRVKSNLDNGHKEQTGWIDIHTNQMRSDSTKATKLSVFLNARQAESSRKSFVDSYPSQVMYEAHQKGDLFYQVKPGDFNQEEIYDARIALRAAERKMRVSLPPAESADYNTFIGNMYRSGLSNFIDSVALDTDSMARWFFEKAILGENFSNGTAEFWLGLMYELGRGVDKEKTTAIKFYERSIQNFNETHRRSMLAIENPKTNDSMLLTNTHPLHSIGVAEVYYRLAKIYEESFVKDENQVVNFQSRRIRKNILFYYEEAAALGLAAAQYRLAEIYKEGLFNTTKSVEAAFYWLKKVIFQSVNIQTYNEMYSLYVTSARYQLDVERLMKAQFYLAQILAEQGNAEAAFNLANMYAEGRGVVRNTEKAIYWYEQSIEKGYLDAFTKLALIYQEGRGVARDIDKAERLYKEAAERGSAEAPYRQALIYENRIVSDKELSDVQREKLLQGILKLYTLAASRGFVLGQISAAKMYEEGRGVTQDLNRALDFYEKARFQGSKEAQESFDRLARSVPGRNCAKAMLSVVH